MDPVPRLAVFVPILSSLGVLRLMGISFGLPPNSLPLSVRGLRTRRGFAPQATTLPQMKLSTHGRVRKRSEPRAVSSPSRSWSSRVGEAPIAYGNSCNET